MNIRTRKTALTEGIIAGTLFGTAAILIRLLNNVDPFSIAFWRLIIACAILALIALLTKQISDLSAIRDNLKDVGLLGFFLSLHFIFFVFAVKDTSILNATVLVNTVPVLSVLVSAFVYKTKPSRLAILGLIISLAGVCLIAFAESFSVNDPFYLDHRPTLKGDIEAILAAGVEAFYLNHGRKVRSRMHILPVMLPIYLFTTICVAIIGTSLTGKLPTFSLDSDSILFLFGLGLLPTAIAHTLYFSSLSNLKSFETATMALLEPLGSTLLGIALIHEIPGAVFGLGAALVLGGVFFVLQKPKGVNVEKVE